MSKSENHFIFSDLETKGCKSSSNPIVSSKRNLLVSPANPLAPQNVQETEIWLNTFAAKKSMDKIKSGGKGGNVIENVLSELQFAHRSLKSTFIEIKLLMEEWI